MNAAAKMLDALAECGAWVAVDGDRVRVLHPAGKPLPAELVLAARELKAELRALVAGTPGDAAEASPGWAERFALLNPDCPLAGFSSRRWRDVLRDGALFLATWATQAAELGWTEQDLFGAHRIAPEARWDCAGLVLLIGGGRVVAMTASSATIQRPSGSRLTYSRMPAYPEAVPLWELPAVP
jgi:hypothetical protein